MTTIGYATLQIIPSLTGVSDSVSKQLGGLPGMGKKAGQQLGSGIAAGVRASESDIKRAFDNHAKLADRAADATGKLRTAEAQLQQLRKSGANDARITAGEERAAKARRDEIRLVNDAKSAYRELDKVRAAQSGGGPSFLSKFLTEDNARSVGAKVGRALGLSIKAAAGAGIAGIGYALFKGFDRLQSIDQAKFKLQALGNSATDVQTIMDSALASVKGTAFGLQDAATAAASAIAAAIKPGQDLTKYLSEVGDAAAVAGTNFTDMGSIFNKIQTSNKAYTDDLNQLADRGLPIFKWLRDEYGVTAEALTKMVENGEVDAEHFQKAIDKNIGGAAQKMGQSFDGAVDNMEASVARLGANFITAILGGDPVNALAGPTEAITNLTDKFDQIGVWVVAHRDEIHAFFEDIKTVAIEVGGAVRSIGTWLVENKGAAETLAAVFVGWKVASVVLGVVDNLKSMGLIMRTQLPADATAGASGISKALSLIVIPEIGKLLNDQLQQFLKDNAPDLYRLNNTNTPDQLGKNFRDFIDGSHKDDPSGLPTPQANAPANTRDSGGLPTVVNGLPAAQAAAPAGTRESGGVPVWLIPPKASGGAISGPGTGTSDSILARLSNGEFIVNAAAARKNLSLLEIINSGKLPGFASGGRVAAGVDFAAAAGDGRPYVYGGVGPGYDCSGFMSGIYGAFTGKSTQQRYFTTESDFESLGFVRGSMPGAFNIGVRRGGGGRLSHMAGTLPNGVNVESGGSHNSTLYGGAAAGAGAFPLKWYLPVGGGDDPNAAVAASPFAGGSAAAAVTPSGGGSASGGSGGGGSTASSGGFSLPSSFSGLATMGLSQLGSGIGTTKSGSDLSLFGDAAASAVTGQIDSALGVFGVPGSPPWLQAASQLIGGISIGGDSASPLSASPAGTGTPPPDDAGNMHGIRAGQQPGPSVVINARDTEDAFIRYNRLLNERSAAKLSHL